MFIIFIPTLVISYILPQHFFPFICPFFFYYLNKTTYYVQYVLAICAWFGAIHWSMADKNSLLSCFISNHSVSIAPQLG